MISLDGVRGSGWGFGGFLKGVSQLGFVWCGRAGGVGCGLSGLGTPGSFGVWGFLKGASKVEVVVGLFHSGMNLTPPQKLVQ